MRKALLLVILLCAPLLAQTSYYNDRAVGVSPFGAILGLVPIQYGQVRVCTLPLTQVSPCLPLASITGVPGFPVDTSGTKFGQVVTLVTGQFAFGCTPSTTLQIQVATQSSNTPMLSYPASCPGGTTVNNTPHNLLSVTHPDTVPKSPPDVGDLIYGSPVGNPPTGLWAALGIGNVGQVLTVGPKVLGKSSPEWDDLPASSGCDYTNVHNWYVDTTGSDTTGDGTIGNPWATPGFAISQLPGLVCGRYIIHLKSAGTYNTGPFDAATNQGRINLSGRVCDGGGLDNGAGNPPVQWPINDGNSPPAYSWVEILGDDTDTAPSTYIIDPTGDGYGNPAQGAVVTVSGCNLMLRGLTIKKGAFGLKAANHSFVSMSGVLFTDNGVGFMATEGSTIHIDNFDYVDPAFTSNVLVTNLTNSSSLAWIIDAGSLLTDYYSDGNNTNTFAILGYESGTGTTSIACGLVQSSSVYFRGTINCDVDAGKQGIVATDSQLTINKMTLDGHSAGTNTGLRLEGSGLSGAAFGGGNYTIENSATGISLDSSSWIDSTPSLSGNTVDWNFGGLTGNPAMADGNVNGRVASMLETVTFSATPVFNMTKGAVKKITLTGDVTSFTVTNPPTITGIAEELTLIICQDGAGNHTVAWPASMPGHGTIAATASKCNVQRFIYDVAASKWWSLSAMETGQ